MEASVRPGVALMAPSRAAADNSAMPPRVDVVIPCYNEVKVLEQSVLTTLALFEQNPQYDWRLVIADNGSNDGTSELARQLEDRYERVKALVTQLTERPSLGILGEPRVNVLRLNMVLDQTFPRQAVR